MAHQIRYTTCATDYLLSRRGLSRQVTSATSAPPISCSCSRVWVTGLKNSARVVSFLMVTSGSSILLTPTSLPDEAT